MLSMLLSEEGAPHPLVIAIIAIALSALLFGGCVSGGCDDCCTRPTSGETAR